MIRALAVVPGRVTLSFGREADHDVDLRRVTRPAVGAPLAGRVKLDLTAELGDDAAGRLTSGADLLATAAARGGRTGPAAPRLPRSQGGHGPRPAAQDRGSARRGPQGRRDRAHLDCRRLRNQCRRGAASRRGSRVETYGRLPSSGRPGFIAPRSGLGPPIAPTTRPERGAEPSFGLVPTVSSRGFKSPAQRRRRNASSSVCDVSRTPITVREHRTPSGTAAAGPKRSTERARAEAARRFSDGTA